jgi:ATP-dependent 26S proteasome regulatory subunit
MVENLGHLDNYVYVTLITLLLPQIQKVINKLLDLFNNNIDLVLRELLNHLFKEKTSKYSISINYNTYFTKNGGIDSRNFQYYNSVSKKLAYYINDHKERVIDNNKFNIVKTNNFYDENSKTSMSDINSTGTGDGTDITIDDILIKVKYNKIYYKDGEKKEECRIIIIYSDVSINKIEEFLTKIDNHFETYNKKYFSIRPYKNNDIKLYELNYKNIIGLDSMFFPEKEDVKLLINKFETKQIDKLGLVLYGHPGTSKTTLVRAIGKQLNRDIISIKLSKIETYTDLITLLHSNKPSVFVFEDVDADTDIVFRRVENDYNSEKSVDFIKYENDKDDKELYKEKLSLYDLLNIFDGILPLTDSVIIMTTNHFEKLDPALIRPGRFNKCIELKKLNVINIIEIINFHYKIDKDIIKNKFKEILKDNSFTSAQIYEYIIESDTIEDLYNLIKSL